MFSHKNGHPVEAFAPETVLSLSNLLAVFDDLVFAAAAETAAADDDDNASLFICGFIC